ncbi:SDR family NAD(P)-dependent oxidoreductase [Pseudochelatococcus sp. B33]
MSDLARWFSLEGKVALVTGSARGLGWAMAQALAGAGAHIILNDINEEALEASARELAGKGGKVSTALFDVTDEAAVRQAVAQVTASTGTVDILVNNAGFQNRKNFIDYELDEIRKLMDIHYFGSVNVTRAVIPGMQAKRGGRLIFVSSLSLKSMRVPMSAYAGAKGALTSLMNALAMELGPWGITSNAIAPGFFITEMSRKLVEDEAFNAYIKNRVALNRWGDPSDLEAAVVFLAGHGASYITGQVIEINGGILTTV